MLTRPPAQSTPQKTDPGLTGLAARSSLHRRVSRIPIPPRSCIFPVI